MKQLFSAELLPVSHKTSVSCTVLDSRSFLNITTLSLPLSLPKPSSIKILHLSLRARAPISLSISLVRLKDSRTSCRVAPGAVPMSDKKHFQAQHCLMHSIGEKILGQVFQSPSDCRAGFTRNTVCATNLRVIVNTHRTYFCCLQADTHESIFYECGPPHPHQLTR
jgi:hypothetical protein